MYTRFRFSRKRCIYELDGPIFSYFPSTSWSFTKTRRRCYNIEWGLSFTNHASNKGDSGHVHKTCATPISCISGGKRCHSSRLVYPLTRGLVEVLHNSIESQVQKLTEKQPGSFPHCSVSVPYLTPYRANFPNSSFGGLPYASLCFSH